MLLFRGLILVLLTGGTISGLSDQFTAIGAGWLPGIFGESSGRDVLTLLFGVLAVLALGVQLWRSRVAVGKLGLPREPTFAFTVKLVIAAVAILWFA